MHVTIPIYLEVIDFNSNVPYYKVNMWPSQLNRNSSSCEVGQEKDFSGLQWDSNPWPLHSCWSALTSWAMTIKLIGLLSVYGSFIHCSSAGKSTATWMQRPWVWIPLKPRKTFFGGLLHNSLNYDSTVMVTCSLHLYSCSSHHFILCTELYYM